MNEILQSDPSDLPNRNSNLHNLRNIARNSAAMLLSQVLMKVLAFLFSVYVVRRLGAADFGLFSSIMAFAFILSMLTDLGTSTLVIRKIARIPETAHWIVPDVITIRTILSILMIIGNTLAAWLLGRPPEFVIGIFIASFGLVLYAFQGPLDGLLIAKERLDYSSLFNILYQITFVVIGTLALYTGKGYIGLLIATLVGIFVKGLAAFIMIRKSIKVHFFKPNITRWKNIIKESLPFGFIGIIGEFTDRFAIVFMSFVLTFSAVGYYNVSLNLILSVMLIAQSLALAIFPSIVKEYNSGRGSIQNTVQRAMRFLLLLSLPMAIGGFILAELIIITLYGDEFREAIVPFKIMVWALPLMYLAEILGRAIIAMHLERREATYSAISALITIGLSLLLIPRLGVVGAAWGLVIKNFINIMLSVYILGRKMVFEDNIIPLARVFLAGSVMGIILYLSLEMPAFKTMNDKLTLLILISLGTLVYGILAFSTRAISPGETSYLIQAITKKFRRI